MTARRDRICRNHPDRFGFAALLGAGVAAAVMAARAQMPPDLIEKIAAMDQVVDPENTGKLFSGYGFRVPGSPAPE